jgi:hypothetical protein
VREWIKVDMTIQLHFYENFALGFSRSLQSNWHSHLALQLTLGLQGDFQSLTPDDSSTTSMMEADSCEHTPSAFTPARVQSTTSEFACFAPK